MAKTRRGIATLLVIGLFAVGIFFGVKLARWMGSRPTGPLYNTPAIIQQVQTLSELVTVKYVLEKVEVWNDPPQNLLGQFFAGDNRILLLAHGVVKAGVDFSQFKPEDLQITGRKIVIHMPAARITDAYLDDGETKVIERTTGFLRTFDKDLEQNIRRTAVEDIRRAAGRGGILKDADERARTQLKDFFQRMGFEQVEFRTGGSPEVWPAS
jgi:hypothetical protein